MSLDNTLGHNAEPDPIEAEIISANGMLTAAGHVIDCTEADQDLRQALRGEITFDEVIERAAVYARE